MAFKIPQIQTSDRLLNQMQLVIAAAIEPIFDDLSGAFQVSLTGCTTVPSGITSWQRATSSGPLTMTFPLLTGTSNTAVGTLTGLPAVLWPASQQAVLLRTYNNGTIAIAPALINTDGTIQLFISASSTVFTTSGTKGIALSTVTYSVSI